MRRKRFFLESWKLFLRVLKLLRLSWLARHLVGLQTSKIQPFPLWFRIVINNSLGDEDLGGEPEVIDVVVPTTAKDSNVLTLVLESALKNIVNPIAAITIVCPVGDVDNIKSLVFGLSPVIKVVDEETYLEGLIDFCNLIAPTIRAGWTKQQAIKYVGVLSSEYKGTLILDSDTILLTRKNWLNKECKQLISISDEYHFPYQRQYLDFSKKFRNDLLKIKMPRVSYVTHHQLMQKRFLAEFLGREHNKFTAVKNWLSTFDFRDLSPGCEYHCYGTYMATYHSNKLHYASWGNVGVNRKNLFAIYSGETNLKTLSKVYRKENSISLHSYL